MTARSFPISRRALLVAALALAALAVAGTLTVRALTSSGGVEVEPAPLADAPACARLAEDYPDRLEGLGRTETDTAGAAVWGDGKVVVRCGMKKPPPSADSCATVDGVDWLWRERESGEGRKVLLTFGRVPGVEASISDEVEAVDGVLVELSRLVRQIDQRDKCLS